MRLPAVGVLLVLSSIAAAQTATDPLRLPPVFGHGMVLQREVEVPIWGTAAPGSTVIVTFAGQRTQTVADGAGSWRTRLAPLAARSEPDELRVTAGQGTAPEVCTNVVVGDVWLCSGQSNMAVTLGRHREAQGDDFALIRQYTHLARVRSPHTTGGSWEAATPGNRADFTSTGYYFARKLHRELGVPVGIIKEAVSGSLIEPWIPRETLLGDPDVKAIVQGQPATLATNTPGAFVQTTEAGRKFVGFIEPLIPYAIKGIIWYQGEANARTAASSRPYGHLLSLLIRSWRTAWGAGDLPFYYVQLPSIRDPQRTYYLVREQMLQTLGTLPHIGMAVSIDVNEGLHPPSKHIIGERLALLALRDTYGRELVACGPLFSRMEVVDGKAVCHFTETGSGLEAKGGALTEFVIAGQDRQFHAGAAEIAGGTVVVSSPAVPAPVAVRYAWSNAIDRATLYNREGLPASPFRTDDW